MFGPETLLLFDIDGTLLGGMPPTHRQAICEAAHQVFALSLTPDQITMTAGRTDTAIVYRVLEQVGLARSQITPALPTFFAAMENAYARLRLPDLRPYLLPAVAETLAWLDQRGAALGLVTGNLTGIAWSKLSAAGIRRYFQCGAFGEEAEARDALPALAAARAHACFGRAFRPENTFVIGDTPFDIACGAACGFRTIAVATGLAHSFDDLDGHRPDFLLRTLSELPKLADAADASAHPSD
ncbi:MAG TPA: HAD hydrolase-like protein [Ktedonobacterales bacterium]|nr:HAD hydrolase-like protein [Ktedonobacterales bacterium]